MTKVVSIHSYRRGTGKTNITVNLAVLMAIAGKKIAVIDAAFQGPSIQYFFDLNKKGGNYFINDYMDERCEIDDVVSDVTPFLGLNISGQLFLAPAANTYFRSGVSSNQGFQVERLENGITKLIKDLSLDVVLIDTSAGMKDDALMPLVISDVVIEILRLDQQDYQGTAVITEIARKLDIPRVLLVVNIVSTALDPVVVQQEIEKVYHLDVAGVLPVYEEMLALPDGELFVLNYPNHPITRTLQSLTNRLI